MEDLTHDLIGKMDQIISLQIQKRHPDDFDALLTALLYHVED